MRCCAHVSDQPLRGRRQLATGLRHGARVATAALADAAMLRQSKTRLAHPRIEPDIAHELLRRGETADVANRRDEACGHDDVDAGGLNLVTGSLASAFCFHGTFQSGWCFS